MRAIAATSTHCLRTLWLVRHRKFRWRQASGHLDVRVLIRLGRHYYIETLFAKIARVVTRFN